MIPAGTDEFGPTSMANRRGSCFVGTEFAETMPNRTVVPRSGRASNTDSAEVPDPLEGTEADDREPRELLSRKKYCSVVGDAQAIALTHNGRDRRRSWA